MLTKSQIHKELKTVQKTKFLRFGSVKTAQTKLVMLSQRCSPADEFHKLKCVNILITYIGKKICIVKLYR